MNSEERAGWIIAFVAFKGNFQNQEFSGTSIDKLLKVSIAHNTGFLNISNTNIHDVSNVNLYNLKELEKSCHDWYAVLSTSPSRIPAMFNKQSNVNCYQGNYL